MTASEQHSDSQMRDLAAFSDAVRALPHAISAQVTTSDQAMYGFVLTDVTLRDGLLLSDDDPETLDTLRDSPAVYGPLGNLDWDGVVREDKHGDATVPLRRA